MTIGIDASRANKNDKTGTEWYSWHLIQELKKIVPVDIKVVLYANEKLSGELGGLPQNWQIRVLSWPPKYLWTQLRLWWELQINPPDVLLVPAHTIPLLPIPRSIKVAVNVHDVGFKRSPELYKPIQVWYHDLTMWRIKARADLIITISKFSQEEIIELYGVRPEKIKVVYLGFDAEQFHLNNQEREPDQAAVLQKYNIAKPYLFYVGRLEKKKNIGNIVKAFALAKMKREDLKLVLAGASGNQYEEIKNIISADKLESEVILTGYIDNEDLPTIYGNASVFVFPTLYEGFGLPILEAMASGTPVVTSDQSPHTEVGGSAVLYARPNSADDIADKIIKLLIDDNLRQEMIGRGFNRAKEFSWRQTATEVYQAIKSLANNY
ncbi:MAG: glycosyltransferase family 1 protein [Patescibacteria group bacterium]|jgi:glycosyltransferase involved in cell wall biosynthesis